MNLMAYIIQVLIIVILIFLTINPAYKIGIFKPNDILTPVNMNVVFVYLGWMIVLLFQAAFVIAALPICNPGEHFKNIVVLKVKYAFMVYCLFQAGGILGYSIPAIRQYFIPAISLIIVKIIAHFLGYKVIKYKDDGRDYVSIREFICIHMTFSILHAWLTYFLIFNIF